MGTHNYLCRAHKIKYQKKDDFKESRGIGVDSRRILVAQAVSYIEGLQITKWL